MCAPSLSARTPRRRSTVTIASSPLGRPACRHSVDRLITTRPLACLQTAKSFYILLFLSSRVSRNSHITFTRRPCHRVYLYAWLPIFTYFLSNGYVTHESSFPFFTYIIHEHHVSFSVWSLHRSSGVATQSKHYTSVLFEPALRQV